MTTDQQSKQIKRIVGEIISHKTAKTAVIKVTTVKAHPKYHKRFNTTKNFVAHDENDEYKTGDRVEIIPCRPRSRTKRFQIIGKIS